MADIVTLTTGMVTCQVAVTTNDGADDDARFDAVAPTGWVYLRPRRSIFPEGSPTVAVIPDVVSLVVREDGWAVMADQDGVPVGDTVVEIPVVEGMTWQVSMDLSIPAYPWQSGVERNRIRVDPFDIPVEAGKTTNIADYLPLGVDPDTGATWVKGDPGAPGKSVTSVRAVGGQAIFTLSDGTDLDPITLPKGNDGAGIPTGGTTDQVPARTADGGSRWADVASLVPDATTDASGLMSAADKTTLDATATAASVTSGDASTLSSAKSYADSKDAATLAAAKAYTDSHQSSAIRADLISKLTAPLVVSHRGGALVHPEHSMEGYEASMKAGFIPEQDIQFLSDGTPVLCHDTTVDRTMVGATGNVSSLNLQQWKACRIINPVPGGKTAAPLTFEEVLDQLGGRCVLMPEIKNGGTSAETNRCIDMVKERGLDRAVIFQSFSYTTVKQVINAGLECVFLMGSTIPTAVATMQADGVKWVSPSKSMTNADMQTMIDAGLKVIPYTITTPTQRAALPSGCFGYFSNDGWWTEGRLQGDGVPRWTYGQAWPRRIMTNTTGVDQTGLLSIVSGGLRMSGHLDTAANTLDLGHVTGGTVTLPLAIEATFDFGARGSQTRSVGFHVWANTNGDVPFSDSATAGQNGFAFALRRNGQMQVWEYANGAAASEIGSAVTLATAPASAGTNGTARMRLEITTTGIRWVHVDSGTTWQLSRSVTSRDYRLGLRTAGAEVTVRDLFIDPNFDA